MSGFTMKSYWCGLVLFYLFVFVNGKKKTGDSLGYADFIFPEYLKEVLYGMKKTGDSLGHADFIIPEYLKGCRTTDRNWWQLVDSLGFCWNQSLCNVTIYLEQIQYSHGNLSDKVDRLNASVYDVSKHLYDVGQQQHSLQAALTGLAAYANKTDEKLNELMTGHSSLLATLKSMNSTTIESRVQIATDMEHHHKKLAEAMDKNDKNQQSYHDQIVSLQNDNNDSLQNNLKTLNNAIQTRHETLLGQIQQNHSLLQQTLTDFFSEGSRLAEKTKGLILGLSEQMSKSDEKINGLNAQISQHESDFKNFKGEIQSKLSEVDSKAQQTKTELLTSIKQGTQKVDDLKADILKFFSESEKRDENQKKEIGDLQESLNQLFKLFTDTSESQSTKIRKVYDHTVVKASEDNSSYSFLFIMVMSGGGFVVGILCMIVVSNRHTPQPSVNDARNHVSSNRPVRVTEPSVSTRRQEVDNTFEHETRFQDGESPVLLVIGFSDITIGEHLKRVTTLFAGTADRIGSYVVKSLSHGRNIPTCSYYIVFVDFNERNVILETPDLIQGELRYKTVQLLRNRGDVFVVYTGDEGSNHLHAGSLYNQYLTSVTTNDLLTTLNQQSRVMSISRTFNDTQRNLLIETCTMAKMERK